MKLTEKLLIGLLLGMTIYSRFINLNWDQGWGFHPDENNLWGASRRVSLFSQLDPDFYAYGGFPIYFYSLMSDKVMARATSALIQIAIVILIYKFGTEIAGKTAGILAATMTVLTAGLVQAAHFLTVESWLGLFGLLVVVALVKYQETKNWRWLIVAAVSLGLGIGTKLSFVVFGLPVLGLLRSDLGSARVGPFQSAWPVLKVVLVLLVSVLIFFLTNPFMIHRWPDVLSTLKYEADVAMGKLPVFYTRQFIGTIPGYFQAAHIFPATTGWLFLPLVAVGAWVARRKTVIRLGLIAALLSFVLIWAKWTRYVVQVLPLMILIAGVGAAKLWRDKGVGQGAVILAMALFVNPFWNMLRVYRFSDTRIMAANWAEANIPPGSGIVSEALDLGILPFNPAFQDQITLFNFYELDDDPTGQKQLQLDRLLAENEYFISPSRRVWVSSLQHPDKYPKSTSFYYKLLDGSGYYKLINKFTVQSDVDAEETFEVFDHPTVMIFKNLH